MIGTQMMKTDTFAQLLQKVRILCVAVWSALRSRSFRPILVALLVYIVSMLVYIAPVLPSCRSTFLGSPGDQTNLTWLNEANPNVLWGPTDLTNAPWGENLAQPQFVTGILFYAPTRLVSRFVGPVCAYNTVTATGFVFSALTMFLLVFWLTRRHNFWGALLAGYAVVFNSYIQTKTPFHPSYVFCGILIALLWLLILLRYKRRLRTVLAIGIVGAGTFYFDPYFPLLAFVLIVGFVLGGGVYDIAHSHSLRRTIEYCRSLLMALPLALLLLSPIIYVRVHDSVAISAAVSSARGDITSDSLAFSARPLEYILPSARNPFVLAAYSQYRTAHMHGSGAEENTIYAGLVVLLLVGYLFWRVIRHGDKTDVADGKDRSLLFSLVGVVAVAGIVSLPPLIHVLGITVRMPSDIIIHITDTWRVFARLFVVVEIGLVMLAALGLGLLLKSFKRKPISYVVVCLLFAMMFIEYLPYNPLHRDVWTINDVPNVYSQIKKTNSIKTIAEYPLLDPPRDGWSTFYLAYQLYYRKPMINSALTDSPQKTLRESIMDLGDWQTPGALKALGVDRIVLHNNDPYQTFSGFTFDSESFDKIATKNVELLAIDGNVTPKNYVLVIGPGFDGPSRFSYNNVDYYMHQSGELVPTPMPHAKPLTSAMVKLEYYAFEKTPRRVDIKQAGRVVATVYPTEAKQVVEFTIDPGKSIDIYPQNPPKDYSFVVSNMEVE